MSDPAATAAKPSASQPPLAFPHPWRVAVVVAVIMVLLALLGVGLTTAKPDAASVYWISLVPIYGVLCILTAYMRSRRGEFDLTQVHRQVFHWLGIGIAVGLDFYIKRTGGESGTGAGMVALLLLAVGCFLAGIHFQWLFILVGVLLALTLVVVGTAQEYWWLILVVSIVAVVLMFLLPRLFGKR